MPDRLDMIRRAKHGFPCRGAREALRLSWQACIGAAGLLIITGSAIAQEMTMMPLNEAGGWDSGGPPVTSMGEGSYFSQDLGTTLRARFNTRSYGQDARQDGNLDIGTMQVVNWDDSIAFFDGQVTLSDVQGVGFNLGIGYRWLSYLPTTTDADRITGVSLWGDGTSTEASNFFPQLGVSFESLGDLWDLRANGYIPIGQDSQIGNFIPTGVIGFQSNFISELATATVDQSFYAAEVELARRLGRERDAWGFVGAYELANDIQDTTGARAGFRGYAYPDLLLQIAVTHDDIFDTNTTFSLTWFIGRTRTNFHPACGVLDRFREPVMRNDYVALSQSTAIGGTPLTDADGRDIRVVHVDSSASPGGDGTFERPLNNLDDIDNNSQVRDIIFAHAESIFTGQSATLQSNQRFLGEGDGFEHLIVTQEAGTIPIPESSPGAADAPRPIIMAALGDAVTIGDLNEVANFTIDGGTRAIVAGTSGAGNPNLHDLTISNTTGDGIHLSPFVRIDTNDADNDGNVTERTVAFNVTIRDITFDNIGGDDIDLDAFTNADVTDPNVTLQETITVSDVVSTNGNSRGVLLQNTHSAGTFTLSNYTNTDGTTGATEGRLQFNDVAGDITISNADIMGGTGYALSFLNVDSTTAVTVTQLDYDGMTGAAGAIRMDTFDGTLTASNSTLQNGTLNGISILNQSDGTFTFQDTVTMTNLGNMAGAIAFEIDGGVLNQFTGMVTVSNDIANDLGRSVAIRNISDAATTVTFSGDITDTGQGILVDSNTGGTILFLGDLDLDTDANTAILVTDNTGADINFAGDTDITTTTGNGFDASGGGTLTVSNTDNSIMTTTGQIARITGMTVSNAGVNFGEVNRTASAATNAVQLETNTGGPILIGTLGDDAGESGTITGGTADAILVRNSANVTISGLRINNGGNAVSGVMVDKTNNNAMIANINDLEINGGDIGLEVDGNGTTGALTMTVNDTSILSSTAFGMSFDDVDTGSVQVNNATVDGNNASATAGGVRILNSNASFTFDSATAIQEFGGTDFEVNGGAGTVSMNGDITNASATNPLDTTGRSIHLRNITGGSVAFGTNNATIDDNEGLLVENNTGGTINFLGTYDLDTTTNDAVTMTNNTGATISIGELDIVTTTGNGFVATGGGSLSVLGTNNNVTTTGGRGIDIENMTIGAVDFESVNANGGDHGIRLVNNLTGTVTVGNAGNSAGDGGTIQNTTDAGVHVTNSNITLNGVTVQNAGDAAGENGVEIFHNNALNMTANLNRLTVTNATASRDGVLLDGTGDTGTFNANVQNLNVNVTGDGFVANEGVNLTGSGTNNITSDTGVGLTLTDITIGGAGANFTNVTVTNGATNGVVMQNVTGGQVAINGTGATAGSGGMLTTAGNAIVLTNVQDVDLRNMTVVNASGAGADGIVVTQNNTATTAMDVTIDNMFVDEANDAGLIVTANDNSNFTLRLLNSDLDSRVEMSGTGSGNFAMLVQDTTVDTHVGAGDIGFSLQISGSVTNADVTLRNLDVVADDASALFVNSSGGAAKTFDLLIDQGSSFTNDDADSAALIQATGGTTINASIFDGDYTNNGAGEAFEMVANGAGVRARLDLQGNTANAGVGNFVLNNVLSASNFEVFDLTNTFNNSRNTGTVVPLPNAAAFTNRVTPVPLPTIP
ncbi:MAG: hypothetical protein WD468_12590 [Pirellulales bacterium]